MIYVEQVDDYLTKVGVKRHPIICWCVALRMRSQALDLVGCVQNR